MIFGSFPADSMRVGCGIGVGMTVWHRNNQERAAQPNATAGSEIINHQGHEGP